MSLHRRWATLRSPNGMTLKWERGLPGIIKAVYGLHSSSSSICEKVYLRSTLLMKYVSSILLKIPYMVCKGYASFTVNLLSFLASKQKRVFPGFRTMVFRILYGLSLTSITFKSNILSISLYVISCIAGEIG